jgi:hypothetical protein
MYKKRLSDEERKEIIYELFDKLKAIGKKSGRYYTAMLPLGSIDAEKESDDVLVMFRCHFLGGKVFESGDEPKDITDSRGPFNYQGKLIRSPYEGFLPDCFSGVRTVYRGRANHGLEAVILEGAVVLEEISSGEDPTKTQTTLRESHPGSEKPGLDDVDIELFDNFLQYANKNLE